MDVTPTLPAIDEHEIVVNASAEEAWSAVIAVFLGTTTRPLWQAYAQAVRCTPDHASGDPFSAGATVPGFQVMRSLPPKEWALEGKHVFSRYGLTFRITPVDDRQCRITAASSAEFPGLHGSVYRALVIGTGGHVLGVRGMLRNMKHRAERSTKA